jgi:hypothetical protein
MIEKLGTAYLIGHHPQNAIEKSWWREMGNQFVPLKA